MKSSAYSPSIDTPTPTPIFTKDLDPVFYDFSKIPTSTLNKGGGGSHHVYMFRNHLKSSEYMTSNIYV